MGYKPAYIWNGSSFDQIGNQAVASLDDYALLSPVSGQTLTNTTLSSPIINTPTISSAGESGTISGTRTYSGAITLTGTVSGGTLSGNTIDSPYLVSPGEKITVSATAATGTVNFDCKTQGIVYYTSNASANWTMNFRGDSSTTLNSFMSVGESLSVLFLVTQGATAYYPTAYQIDGTAITPKWSGGTAPLSGNINAINAYSISIIKTGSAQYTMFAAQGVYS